MMCDFQLLFAQQEICCLGKTHTIFDNDHTTHPSKDGVKKTTSPTSCQIHCIANRKGIKHNPYTTKRILHICLVLLHIFIALCDAKTCILPNENNNDISNIINSHCDAKNCDYINVTKSEDWKFLQFSFCNNYYPGLSLNDTNLTINATNAIGIEIINEILPSEISCDVLGELDTKDKEASGYFEEFKQAFSQYDNYLSNEKLSTKTRDDCEESYKAWVCASILDTFVNGTKCEKDTKAITMRVCTACPEFTASDDYDYVGTPAFECHFPGDGDEHKGLQIGQASSNSTASICQHLYSTIANATATR